MPAYTITNTKLLNVLLLCLSLVKNRNVIILFFTDQWITSEDLQGRLLLSPVPAKHSGGYGNAGRPSEICCKRFKIFICWPIDF